MDTNEALFILLRSNVYLTPYVFEFLPESDPQKPVKYGLIPPVVMEFPGITAGGGFAGTGGESSSYKYGYFNETVNSVEMVLGNGDIVTASEKENSDLFYGASGVEVLGSRLCSNCN